MRREKIIRESNYIRPTQWFTPIRGLLYRRDSAGLPKLHPEAALPFQVLEAYIQAIEKQIIISVYLW